MKKALKDKRWWWIIFGSASVALSLILRNFPSFVETVYTRGIFVGIRWIQDHTIGLFSIGWMKWIIPALLISAVVWLVLFLKRWKSKNWKAGKGLGEFALSFLAFGGFVGGMFMWMWGYNYSREPAEVRYGIELEVVEKDELIAQLEKMIPVMNATRSILGNEDLVQIPWKQEKIEMRTQLSAVLGELGYPNKGQVYAVRVLPKGLLLRFEIRGIYIPFVGHGYVDEALSEMDHPFTIAHEMAHAFGFTHEGEANFLAFLACNRSDDPGIRYSGYFNYWLYLARALMKGDKDAYAPIREKLSPRVIEDFDDRNKLYASYPPLIDDLGIYVNDAYLKIQGQEQGVRSYNEFLMLKTAFEKANPGYFE